ncbi:hypothetical protein HK105_204898 [Polyrhizophydium stewartii]|uniref:Smr domain-containing protein n=1 Tax=Polyrhizophydium stewartii TaxID=2732419 RepID=A0ABR4N7J4_9FUNG
MHGDRTPGSSRLVATLQPQHQHQPPPLDCGPARIDLVFDEVDPYSPSRPTAPPFRPAPVSGWDASAAVWDASSAGGWDAAWPAGTPLDASADAASAAAATAAAAAAGADDDDSADSARFAALSPLEVLRSVFVDVPPERIQTLLAANDFSIEATMEALFGSQTAGAPAQSASPAAAGPARAPLQLPHRAAAAATPTPQRATVCRHFIVGQCYRSDCWFSHDPEARICKFWLQGRCFKGDACEFAHGDALSERAAAAAAAKTTASSNGLGSSPTRHPAGAAAAASAPPALRLAAEDEFPSLSAAGKQPAASTARSESWGSESRYTDVAKKRASYGGRAAAAATPLGAVQAGHRHVVIGGSGASKAASVLRPASAAPEAAPPSSSPSSSLAWQSKPAKVAVDAKWFSTGDAVAASYAEERREAAEMAIHRNQLFQRATEAYLAGNKAAARAFSLSAKQLNDRVEQLHANAAQRIFESRNRRPAGPVGAPSLAPAAATAVAGVAAGATSSVVGGRLQHMVDLHGLHPNEAVALLQRELDTLVRAGFSGQLVVVTGTGHHSRGQRAKVLPAVREHLQRGGWRPADGTLEDGRGGMLVVQMNP